MLMPMNCNAEMKEVLPIVDYDLCPHLSGTNTEPEIKDYFRHRNTSSLDRLASTWLIARSLRNCKYCFPGLAIPFEEKVPFLTINTTELGFVSQDAADDNPTDCKSSDGHQSGYEI